jgi:hypothetical protein
MAKSPAQFASDLRRFAADGSNFEKRLATSAALTVKDATLRELRVAAPRLRLSGVGKRGARVGVRYDQGNTPGTMLVRATGPVHLIESDTKAHPIPKARKRGRKRYVVIPGVGVRSSVKHPGTSGKHPWRKGVARAKVAAPRAVQEETRKQMGRFFGS